MEGLVVDILGINTVFFNKRQREDHLYAFFVCLFREWYAIWRDEAFSLVAKKPRTKPKEKKL